MAKTVKKIAKRGTIAKRSAKSASNWGGISSDAVAKATGKSWDEWGKLLDKAGASSMPHKDIAELLHTKFKVGPWWSQMVTVGYEQARGLREKHQKADGFSASASRVFTVPISRAYKAVADAKSRAKWLDEEITISKATPGKSIRITWPDGSKVVVHFWDKTGKGDAKTQIVFQHEKLKSAAAVRKTKSFWTTNLDALGDVLK